MILWLRNLLDRLAGWLEGERPEPITRVFIHEFCDRSGVRLTLSTKRPRFTAEFSESPHPNVLLDEFYPWRNGRITEFQQLAQIEFRPAELANEIYRPIPSISRMELEERKRQDDQQRRKRL